MDTNYNLKYLRDEESKSEVRKYIKDYYRKTPLTTETVVGGTVLPRVPSTISQKWMGDGGVVDGNGKFIQLSGIAHVDGEGLVFGGKYEYDESGVVNSKETVIYLGCLFDHWGHFLVDYITRLWYWLKVEKLPLVYCGWGNFEEGKLFGAYERFFELLGVSASQLIDVRKPTKFAKIIIPEPSYLRNGYHTDEYCEVLDEVARHIYSTGLIPHDKVYFSRSEFIKKHKWRQEHGEKVIEETFRQNGFFVVEPSELTLDEQIFYIRNADVFAGIASSNIINTVFSKPGSNRIYIKKCYEMEIEGPHADSISKARRVDVIDGFLLPYKTYRPSLSDGPHMIGMTDDLKKYFCDTDMDVLPLRYYFWSKVRTMLWFATAKTYDFLYMIYYKTIRNTIKKLLG